MCMQIRQKGWNKAPKEAKVHSPKSNWKPEQTSYPGEKVQIDIKYVLQQCIGWDSRGKRYYQITAIDEYSRKRVCKIVDEKSVTHTATFFINLEARFSFSIKKVQTDNGKEFTNGPQQDNRQSVFGEVFELKNIAYQRTRPYSPW